MGAQLAGQKEEMVKMCTSLSVTDRFGQGFLNTDHFLPSLCPDGGNGTAFFSSLLFYVLATELRRLFDSNLCTCSIADCLMSTLEDFPHVSTEKGGGGKKSRSCASKKLLIP